jgi:DNA-binding HxlR family transcriptional regulator
MRRTRFQDWPCSVARTVDLLGDWWTPLVLREAFYGARRFDDFLALGIGRNILAERLARLVDEGILTKVPYHERPTRYEYRLTPKGRDLFGVLAAMIRWGDDWLAGDEGPPVELVDRTTGEVVRPLVVDEHTKRPIDPRALTVRAGPGFPSDRLDELEARARGRSRAGR